MTDYNPCLNCSHTAPHTARRGECPTCGCDAPYYSGWEHGTTILHRLARVLLVYFWEPGQPQTAGEWEKDAGEVASLLERVGLTLVNRPDHWPAVEDDLSHPARDLGWRLKQ